MKVLFTQFALAYQYMFCGDAAQALLLVRWVRASLVSPAA